MKMNKDYLTIDPDKKEIKMKAITYTTTNDFEKVKPRYTIDELLDGKSRAKVIGMHTTRCIQETTWSLNTSFVFEIKLRSGHTIKKVQPIYFPGEDVIDFPYIDAKCLSRLNLLFYDLCHYPERRLGSEGTVIIKTVTIKGEIIQYIEAFIPDVDFDDPDVCIEN